MTTEAGCRRRGTKMGPKRTLVGAVVNLSEEMVRDLLDMPNAVLEAVRQLELDAVTQDGLFRINLAVTALEPKSLDKPA